MISGIFDSQLAEKYPDDLSKQESAKSIASIIQNVLYKYSH